MSSSERQENSAPRPRSRNPRNPQGGRYNNRRRGGNFGRGGRGGHDGGNNFSVGRNTNNNKRNGRSNDANFDIDRTLLNIQEFGSYDNETNTVRVAIQGCSHGSIETIYDTLEKCEEKNQIKVDLLICCGDFQSLRNVTDFETISIPQNYRNIGSFHKYYSGMKKAPVLTLFIGGNHEASSYLQELYYGGWVAPNIYYLGAAGVVRFRGLRIAGISGIHKAYDYRRGRFEAPPYDRSTLRSVYHVREFEVARLKCLSNYLNNNKKESKTNPNALPCAPVVDIMVSHDWPQGIEQHGNIKGLLRKKKYFQQEVEENTLGSPSNIELLRVLKPTWWFAAHLHVKFTATYVHKPQPDTTQLTDDNDDTSEITNLKPSQIKSPSNNRPNQEEIIGSIERQSDSSLGKGDRALSENHTNVDSQETIENPSIIAPPETPTGKNEKLQTSFFGVESLSKQCSGVEDLTDLMTRFLSLDKCLPRKQHMQIMNLPSPIASSIDAKGKHVNNSEYSQYSLHYDLEWLAILQKTHGWTSAQKSPIPKSNVSSIEVTHDDLDNIRNKLKAKYHQNDGNETCNIEDITKIPLNFAMTLQPHGTIGSDEVVNGGRMVGNPQTDELLELLGLEHIITVPYVFSLNGGKLKDEVTSKKGTTHCDSNEIEIDDDTLPSPQNPTQIVRDSNEIIIEGEQDMSPLNYFPFNICDADEIDIEEEEESPSLHIQNTHDLNEIEIDDDETEDMPTTNTTIHPTFRDSNEIEIDDDASSSPENLTQVIHDENEIDIDNEEGRSVNQDEENKGFAENVTVDGLTDSNEIDLDSD